MGKTNSSGVQKLSQIAQTKNGGAAMDAQNSIQKLSSIAWM